jgi:5-methylcytosine-specific restriction endonuclease McrA
VFLKPCYEFDSTKNKKGGFVSLEKTLGNISKLENISDDVLLTKTEALVAGERNMLLQVLQHLKEIDRRRLFSKLGYQSLFEYAVKKLKYSEDQAARRIAAMRLARELPGISEKIEDGSLTLSNIGMAASFFRSESKIHGAEVSESQKLELLLDLNGKTYREAQKIVLQKSSEPEALRPEKVRFVSDSKIEIRFLADATLIETLDRVKGLVAHAKPNLTMAELVEFMADVAIKKLDPGLGVKRPKKKSAPKAEPTHLRSPAAPRVQIPGAIRRQVWKSCQSRCSNCQSVRALEIEHIKPWSKGGRNDIENLTLLCRNCNQRSVINEYGVKKMHKHFASRSSSASYSIAPI